MYPPFWFSALKSKKSTLILLEGNIQGLIISSECSYMVSTLDPSASNMEENTKLINRLSNPVMATLQQCLSFLQRSSIEGELIGFEHTSMLRQWLSSVYNSQLVDT